MAEARVLGRGQWLGQENMVSSLRFSRGRWHLTDTTGATYDQRDFPDGLVTHDKPTDGRLTKPRTAWPINP